MENRLQLYDVMTQGRSQQINESQLRDGSPCSLLDVRQYAPNEKFETVSAP